MLCVVFDCLLSWLQLGFPPCATETNRNLLCFFYDWWLQFNDPLFRCKWAVTNISRKHVQVEYKRMCLLLSFFCYLNAYWMAFYDRSEFLVRITNLKFLLTGEYTGLFKTIVGVLTTCHTQYTWDRSICVFYLIEQHSKFLLNTVQVLYICTLCDSTGLYGIACCS